MSWSPKSRIVSTGVYKNIKYMIREIDAGPLPSGFTCPAKWFTAYIELPFTVYADSLDCHGGCTFESGEWPEEYEPVSRENMIFGWDYNHLWNWQHPASESNVLSDIKHTIDAYLGEK